MVIDMMGVDLFDSLVTRFDEVQAGLLASIMNKSILKDNKYVEKSLLLEKELIISIKNI